VKIENVKNVKNVIRIKNVKNVIYIYGLGLTVIGLGLGLGLMKYWSRSHTLWSRGLKSILCSSGVITSDCVPCSVNTRIWSL